MRRKNGLCARVCGREEDVYCEVKRSGMRCMLLLFVAYRTIPASLGSNGNLHLCVSQEFCSRD